MLQVDIDNIIMIPFLERSKTTIRDETNLSVLQWWTFTDYMRDELNILIYFNSSYKRIFIVFPLSYRDYSNLFQSNCLIFAQRANLIQCESAGLQS